MATVLKDSPTNETQASDMPGSGILTGDQSGLFEKISKYIHGIGFPSSKDDILKQAKQNGADEAVLSSIKKVSEKHYASPAELLKEFGEGQ